MLWEFAFAQIFVCIKRYSILWVCRKTNSITKANSGCHSFDFTYYEKLFSNFFATSGVPPLARLQSTTNVKGWSLFFKKYSLLIHLQPSAQITVSTTMSRSINLSWYLSTQGFGVVLLLNRIALFWRLHIALRPSGPGLLLVQSNLVSNITNSHVIFSPLGSNEQARLLFSGTVRDSLFRGVYVLTNLQRWYCRFSLLNFHTTRKPVEKQLRLGKWHLSYGAVK